MEDKPKLLYVTAGSMAEADKIATKLVEEKLVACANILGSSTAIYRWEGRLTKEKEVVLILKTTAKLVQKSVKRIVGLHSYECPAVIVLEIQDGNKEFLSWISNVTNPNFEG